MTPDRGDLRLTPGYVLRRSKRARRVMLSVHRERGLEVVVPARMKVDRRAIDDFVASKRDWIERALDRVAVGESKPFVDRASIDYRGEAIPLLIAIDPSLAAATLRLTPSGLAIRGSDAATAGAVFESWGREVVRALLAAACDRWEARLGVRRARLRIADPSSRWGSCSKAGTLSFNWRIIMAPVAVFDYLVLHEVAHLVHHDHSRAYWRLVESECPDYDRHRRWLQDDGRRLRFRLT